MARIHVVSRRSNVTKLRERFPAATIVDVTSRGPEPWVKFSPFYPLGGIPVPFTDGRTAQSVEGIWQALKVFETADVDERKLDVTSMRGLKRTVRKHGTCLGHRRGLHGDELLGYLEARRLIYLPVYAWVLQHRLSSELEELATQARSGDLVLLDYETNTDVTNLSRPLSHAGLVAKRLEQLV